METFQKQRIFLNQKHRDALPVTSGDQQSTGTTLRRRLSSLSLNLQQHSPSSWNFRLFPRSKSVSAMGADASGSSTSSSIFLMREWWNKGWSWLLSRKPVFAADLEMDKEESRVLGSQNRGSLMHLIFRVRSQIRKILIGSGNNGAGLPLSNRYDYSVGRR